jgi:hypothetical protein
MSKDLVKEFWKSFNYEQLHFRSSRYTNYYWNCIVVSYCPNFRDYRCICMDFGWTISFYEPTFGSEIQVYLTIISFRVGWFA